MPIWRSNPQWPQRVSVEDASQVAGARRLAMAGAVECGFGPAMIDSVALASTELAENLHRHAVGGELVVTIDAADHELVVITLDRGPGVDRFDECLVDGYSTAGTMGTGLGAVLRRASSFDAVSEPGRGTIVSARFGEAPRRERRHFDVGAVGFALASEPVNGDDYLVVLRESRVVVAVVDGLGHGPFAAESSAAAIELALSGADLEPAASLAMINSGLVAGRGAAASIVSTTHSAAVSGGSLVTAGLGNVAVMVAAPDGTTRRVATDHGTLGARAGTSPHERLMDLPPGASILLHTDGLTTRWNFDGRRELLQHSAVVIAAAAWRDHARGSDDALVVVVKPLVPAAVT